ncbi:MAG: flagellar hook-length control protein FliK [Pseudomonadota bacterium]
MTEPELSFDAIFESLPTALPVVPGEAVAPVLHSGTPDDVRETHDTLLAFLGSNPLKPQTTGKSAKEVSALPDDGAEPAKVEIEVASVAPPLLAVSPLIIAPTSSVSPPKSPPVALELSPEQTKHGLAKPPVAQGIVVPALQALVIASPETVEETVAAKLQGVNYASEDIEDLTVPVIINPIPNRPQNEPARDALLPVGSAVLPTPDLQNFKLVTKTGPDKEIAPKITPTSLAVGESANQAIQNNAVVNELPQLAAVAQAPQAVVLETLAQTADPLHVVVERQLDLSRDARWLDALARDIVAVADRPDQLSFRLLPERLGRLDIDLRTNDHGLSIKMNTTNEAAAQIVAAAQPRLLDELKGQGVRVAGAEVSSGNAQSQSQSQGQQHPQREAERMIEYVRHRIERANTSNLTRPLGRFA